jgi:transcriptional regulator with XRE-family HTH domain
MLLTSLGKAIRERRTSLGITQPQLADLAGISKNTLYKLETGISNPTLLVLVQVAEVLGMELKIEVKKHH